MGRKTDSAKSSSASLRSSREANSSKMYVPSIIGGFAGSNTGVSYGRYTLKEGSIVVRLSAPMLSAEPPVSSVSVPAAAASSSPAGETSTSLSSSSSAKLVFKADEDEETSRGSSTPNEETLIAAAGLDWMAVGMITRMNTSMGSSSTDVELLLGDGKTREKVSVLSLRLAGALEERAYHAWRAKGASSCSSNNSDGTAAVSTRGGIGGTKRPREDTMSTRGPQGLAADHPWWAVPGIVVRVVNHELTSLCGKKYVVAKASKKENRIFLGNFTESEALVSSGVQALPLTGGHAVGLQDVDTVIPKDGGRALVLLGEHRGEVVTVVAKERSDSREIVRVSGKTDAGLILSVKPEEISQLAV
jgi:hypothetical protein